MAMVCVRVRVRPMAPVPVPPQGRVVASDRAAGAAGVAGHEVFLQASLGRWAGTV